MAGQKKYYIPSYGKIKMMNLDNYYLHATGGIGGKKLEKSYILNILAEGKIKTREERGVSSNICNYDDELCLWDPKIKFRGISKLIYLSAIDTFITEGPCLVLSRDINVYMPKLKYEDYNEKKDRQTDIYDEVRHQGNISLNHLKFITFPIEKPKKMRIYRDELYIYKKEIKLIKEDFPDIKVKDIFTGNDLTEESIDNKIEELEQKQFKKMALHSMFRW